MWVGEWGYNLLSPYTDFLMIPTAYLHIPEYKLPYFWSACSLTSTLQEFIIHFRHLCLYLLWCKLIGISLIFIRGGILASVSCSMYCLEWFLSKQKLLYSHLLTPVHPHLSTLNKPCHSTFLSLPGTRFYAHVLFLLLDLVFLRGSYLHFLLRLTQWLMYHVLIFGGLHQYN